MAILSNSWTTQLKLNNSWKIQKWEKRFLLYIQKQAAPSMTASMARRQTQVSVLSLTLFLQVWIFKYICHVLSRLDKNITTIILIRGVLLCEYCPYFAWDLFVCSSTGNQSSVNELSFLHEYMQVPVYGRGLIGHQMKDFIKSCSFGGLECPIDNG